MGSSVPSRARAGFTLVELMVVITVIGVIAASVMPALAEVRSDARQTAAAHEIIRMGRRARALAIERGVAHLLRFQRGDDQRGSFGLGRIELFVGMTNRCRQTPWAQAFNAPLGDPLGVDVTRREGPDVLDMASFNPTDGSVVPTAADAGRQVVALTARGGDPVAARDAIQFCYQPNGETFTVFSAVAGGLAPQVLPVVFVVSRWFGGGARGVAREVVFGVGGNARVRY